MPAIKVIRMELRNCARAGPLSHDDQPNQLSASRVPMK